MGLDELPEHKEILNSLLVYIMKYIWCKEFVYADAVCLLYVHMYIIHLDECNITYTCKFNNIMYNDVFSIIVLSLYMHICIVHVYYNLS